VKLVMLMSIKVHIIIVSFLSVFFLAGCDLNTVSTSSTSTSTVSLTEVSSNTDQISTEMITQSTSVSTQNSTYTTTSNIIQTTDNEDGNGQISFSTDAGANWILADDRMIEFDIWDSNQSGDLPGMVFFYATSYAEFQDEVEINRSAPLYSYLYPDDDEWNGLLEQYDESFFEDNALMFYYKFEPNYSENYVYNVVKDGNSLTLNVNRYEGGWAVLSSWKEIVVVSKADINGITEFNIAVRTITELMTSVTVYPSDEYMREVFVNGLSISDFEGLDNLESVSVWTSSLMVDIVFNETLSADRLNEILQHLNQSDSIISIGYTSNTWIRTSVKNDFFDEFMDQSLTLDDLFDTDVISVDDYSIEFMDITPIAVITLEMAIHGRNYYEAMINQLEELDYPFIRD